MNKPNETSSTWGGRFQEPTDSFVQRFTASAQFDQRMYLQDILGSKAHATMLSEVGILSTEECKQIHWGLDNIRQQIENGQFEWSIELEDVHMNIEHALTQLIGDAGKKLHTGRSRNDQVATDIRLWMRDAVAEIQGQLTRLRLGIATLAQQESATIMPGFTHLQSAQPITFGHHLMAWYEMLCRDSERLEDSLKRINISPLGSAALAGTTFAINRERTSELLGFDRPSNNSLDSVSDRDFAIEFTSNAALIMTHLSRMSEELVLWASSQFNFVDIPDRFCTGSSIMPQKKNPDVPELVRGKTGRVNGHLISLLTLMKSQPLAYNKDNQEDKEPIFDTADTLIDCLRAFADMIPNIKSKSDNMRSAAAQGFSTATDLADYLVRKEIPFREAHEIVGSSVAYAIDQNKDLSELSIGELMQFSMHIGEDVFDYLTLEGSVSARNHIGGTAPNQVDEQAKAAIAHLKGDVK